MIPKALKATDAVWEKVEIGGWAQPLRDHLRRWILAGDYTARRKMEGCALPDLSRGKRNRCGDGSWYKMHACIR